MKINAEPGSISQQIQHLRQGESRATKLIWDHYFAQLINLARGKVSPAAKAVSDEEDLVVGAFNSFFTAVQKGRFPRLDDRDDLWQVLVMLTDRKAADLANHHARKKRGGGNVRGESVLEANAFSRAGGGGLDQLALSQPTPEFAAQVAEQVRYRLNSLNDPVLERIALLKMEGFTNQEIADQLDCRRRTIDRKLRVIRELWMTMETGD